MERRTAASGTARSLQSGVVPGGRPLDLLVSNNPFAAEKSRCAANTTVFCDIKQPMGQLHNTILAVFPDRQVARFRQEVLCDAGFEVFSVHTESAARYEIYLGRCGVLLLCHKLTREEQESEASYFEERCPEPHIIAILERSNDHFPPQTHKCVLHSPDPCPLVQAVRQRLVA